MKPSCLIVAGLFLAAPAFAAQPTVTVEKDRVIAKGMAPGGTAVFFGAAVAQPEWFRHTYHWQRPVADDDGDGTVVYERPEGIPETSVFVVVDVASGSFAVAAPAASGHRGASALHRRDAVVGRTGSLEGLWHHGRRADVLLVREQVGAWHAAAADGALTDHDGARDGGVLIDFADLTPMTAGVPARGGVGAADVLVLIDPDTLEVHAQRVGAPSDWPAGEVAP